MRHLDACTREQLAPMDASLRVALAQVLALAGQHQRAIELTEPALLYGERRGMSGLLIGWLYEGCARVALAGQDTERFQRFAELCARSTSRARIPC